MTPEALCTGELVNGMKGNILLPGSSSGTDRTTTCHQGRSATLIDYCLIGERIIGACSVEAISTPWATHDCLIPTVRAEWKNLVARTVLGPTPFPFGADTIGPKAKAKHVLSMNLEGLQTCEVRTGNFNHEPWFEFIGASLAKVLRNDTSPCQGTDQL